MALLEEIKVPLLAVNDTTLTVVELAKQPGEKIKQGEVLLVFETSKTTYEVEAATEGFVQYLCSAGRDYAVNAVVARIFSEAAEALVTAPETSRPTAVAGVPGKKSAAALTGIPAPFPRTAEDQGMEEPEPYWEGKTLFSNEAGRLIEAYGLDEAVFRGKDLVTAMDVLRLVQTPHTPTGGTAGTAGVPTPTVAADLTKVILEKLTSGKKREIEYLSEIQHTGLTSTIHTHVEVENIFVPINRSLRYLKDSLLPVILYESSRLLVEYPQLNAYFTGDGVALYKAVSPGFAIDIDKGLKVVKVERAGEKTLREIETVILELSGNYLDDKLRLEDLTDITFTITDLGAEAVAFFQPLINRMSSAILGVSAVDAKLQRCTLSLTFDHRVTEGKLAARFLKDLKHRLESYRPDNVQYADISCFNCMKTLGEDLGRIGFMRCITPQGKDGYICQSCIKGF